MFSYFLQEYLDTTFYVRYGRNYTKDDILHIDHIIPLSTAKTVEDVNKLNHYTNLQYLLSFDNLSKGSKNYE